MNTTIDDQSQPPQTALDAMLPVQPTTNPPTAADQGPAAEPEDTLRAPEAEAQVMGSAHSLHVHNSYLPRPQLTQAIINNYLSDPMASHWDYIVTAYDRKIVSGGKIERFEVDPGEGEDLEEPFQVQMPLAVLDISNKPAQGFGLTAQVMTDQVAMVASLGSKIFDSRFAQQLVQPRVLDSALNALSHLLENGQGTSLARPLYYLLSLHLADGPMVPGNMLQHLPPMQLYEEGEGGFVVHFESFKASWVQPAAFEVWSASAHAATTTETHIELSEGILLNPINAAVWVTAVALRRNPLTAIHLYNVPDDPQWMVDFITHIEHAHDQPAVGARYLRAAGLVLHWAQELVAGSGSMSGALWLCALTHAHIRETDNSDTYMWTNALNTIAGSEIVYGPPTNPLVLWAYQQRYVELDSALEPIPYCTRKSDTARLISVYFVAVLAGTEAKLADQGYDYCYQLTPLTDPDPAGGSNDLRLHHEQLEQAKRHAMEELFPLSGIRLRAVKGWQHRADSLAAEIEEAACVSLTSVPVWLIAQWSGRPQPFNMGSDINVERKPPLRCRDATVDPQLIPTSVVTETTNRKVFATVGTTDRCRPRVFLHSEGKYVGLTVVQLSGLLQDGIYDEETYEDEPATMSLVPTTQLFGQDVRVFAATPHDCMSNMVAPLTNVRVPADKVTAAHRQPLPLGKAAEAYGAVFFRD
jgi:hypothetical protein